MPSAFADVKSLKYRDMRNYCFATERLRTVMGTIRSNKGLQMVVSMVIMLSLALVNIWFLFNPLTPSDADMAGNAFVTRSGSNVVLNGKPFRFSGANIYWLGLQENPSISYPSAFSVDDALATAALMGATVVRSHTLGISTGCALCVEPTLGHFNKTALQHIDYAIQAARLHHIKLIIPLTDSWHYYHGGKHTFTDWRGLTDETQFYTNTTVISDFKQYIKVMLNHVNTYNDIKYKDDPTILAWETGNELAAPSHWVQSIANYLKSLDQHHLVMDGNVAKNTNAANFSQELKIKSVDLYTDHFYPPNISIFQGETRQVTSAKKVFIVGEFDWNTNQGDALSKFLTAVQYSKAAGDLYWSLFPHASTFGYIQHQEPYTLHYPGDTADMRTRVSLLRTHANAMQGHSLAILAQNANALQAPLITSVQGNMLAWRGVVGAYTYSVERSAVSASGPYTVVCDQCATDNTTPWLDSSRPTGPIWYRVRAYTMTGQAGPYSTTYLSIE